MALTRGPARMMALNSSRSISPSLFVSVTAIIWAIFLVVSFGYTLRMYDFISSWLMLPLLFVSTLANAASSPASDLSMSSAKAA